MKVPSYTWAGGELAPGLWGRVDLNKYQTGVKSAENYLVAVEGGMNKRWGQYFVGKPKFQDKLAKLVAWRIADDDSYILEFGDEYIRFIRLGGHVLYPTDPGFVPDPDSNAIDVDTFLEVPSPYSELHVRELKFTFANDIVYIFHKDYQPRQLKRLGLYDWSLELTSFNPNQPAPTGLAVVWEEYDSGTATWVAEHSVTVNDYIPTQRDISYKVSATMPDGQETLASAAVTIQSDLGNHHLRNVITWGAVADATQYTVYKGANGIFGFIGYVQAPDTTFIDENFAPSYDVVPVVPFTGFGAGQWPRVGQFYKQRMGYAATTDEPQKLWFSRPTFFDALTTSIPLQDNDAIVISLVGNSRHTINHMLQLKKFILFTDTAEWVIQTTGNSDALSPSSIDPEPETAYGSDPNLEPLAIGDRILFVQNISGAVRDMGYEFTTNAYNADDLSRLSRHLFENKTIEAWAYAVHPTNTLWCVTSDGNIQSMTYAREHEIWGWTHCVTLGDYTDVATVAELIETGGYFQVTRDIAGVPTKFIERTEACFTDRIEDMFYVDCGLTYRDERYFTDLTLGVDELSVTCAGTGLTEGDEILVETTEFSAHLTVLSVIGDVITGETTYLEALPEAVTVTIGSLFICADSFTGFDHLEGCTGLVALADGNVISDVTILDGGFSIPFKAARMHCGFPYTAELETLDLDDERAAGRYIPRSVNSITIRLKNSRGIFAGASESFRDLVEIPSRNTEDYGASNAPLNGAYELTAHAAWSTTCGVRVRSSDPLPANILNIVPDLSYGN